MSWKEGRFRATKAIQAVVNKMDQFVGKDVTKYLRKYVKEMELHRVSKGEMIQSFELVVVLEIKEHCYAQPTRMENATLDAKKTELFLQAAGKDFQEKLELLFEDKDVEQGLKTDWNDVEDVVSLLAK
ncbi:hypothetical protein L7F22_015310 [Adiantum nelumboides]|nr:hypothetical protein [Adiantum nelumboides]